MSLCITYVCTKCIVYFMQKIYVTYSKCFKKPNVNNMISSYFLYTCKKNIY